MAFSEGGKVANEPVSVTIGGSEYKLLPRDTVGLESAFEEHLVECALSDIKKFARWLSDPYEAENRVIRDAAAGGYSDGSDAWVTAMKSVDQQAYYFYLRLKPFHSSVTPEEAKRLWKEHFREVMDQLSVADRDPNPQPPAAEENPAAGDDRPANEGESSASC